MPSEGAASGPPLRRVVASIARPRLNTADGTWAAASRSSAISTADAGTAIGAVLVQCIVLMPDQVSIAGPESLQCVWESGGSPYRVAVRPLLPDESGCDDLAA